ncbi:hypothetical protein Dimus_014274 [Dionaea muscipula]
MSKRSMFSSMGNLRIWFRSQDIVPSVPEPDPWEYVKQIFEPDESLLQPASYLSLLNPPQDHEHHQQADQQQLSKLPQQEAIDIVPSDPEIDWVVSIRKRYESARQKFEERPPTCSGEKRSIINKVPRNLKNGADQKNYIPQVVSLGPYHHGKSSVLLEMEQHKWRALDHILKRHDQDINIYLNAMKELEEEARTCYERPVSYSSEEFVQMMVLDGCFMLELFRGATEGFKALGYAENDPLFSLNSTIFSIRTDMIMLENQIPLFILDKLLSLQTGRKESDQSDQKESVAQLALKFFHRLTPAHPLSNESGLRWYCLDIFRRILPKEVQSFRPPPPPLIPRCIVLTSSEEA